jgi:hypothetical protein
MFVSDIVVVFISKDGLCGLDARVPAYRSRSLGLDSQRFWEVVGLERGPLSLVRIIEELFQENSGSDLENWD